MDEACEFLLRPACLATDMNRIRTKGSSIEIQEQVSSHKWQFGKNKSPFSFYQLKNNRRFQMVDNGAKSIRLTYRIRSKNYQLSVLGLLLALCELVSPTCTNFEQFTKKRVSGLQGVASEENRFTWNTNSDSSRRFVDAFCLHQTACELFAIVLKTPVEV